MRICIKDKNNAFCIRLFFRITIFFYVQTFLEQNMTDLLELWEAGGIFYTLLPVAVLFS